MVSLSRLCCIVLSESLARCIDDPKEFQLITDCILKDVEVSKDPAMAKAQDIVRRLRQRKLYGFVDEYIVTNPNDVERLMQLTPEDVAGACMALDDKVHTAPHEARCVAFPVDC